MSKLKKYLPAKAFVYMAMTITKVAYAQTLPDQIHTESGTFYTAPLKAAFTEMSRSILFVTPPLRTSKLNSFNQSKFPRYDITNIRQYSALEDWRQMGLQILSRTGLSEDTVMGNFYLNKRRTWLLRIRWNGGKRRYAPNGPNYNAPYNPTPPVGYIRPGYPLSNQP